MATAFAPRVAAPPRRFSRSRPVRLPAPPSSPRGWREDSPLAPEDGGAGSKKGRRMAKKKQPSAAKKGKGDASTAQLETVDLGQGKSVSVYVPTNVADVEGDEITYEALESYRDSLFGAGDVIWPASVALARLLAHCPSLVANKRVLEIGAGLGLAGNAAAKAGAASVLMVDRDADMLALAKRSAVENAPHDPGMCRVETLDWSAVPNEWCADGDQKFDVIVAADVLYDEESARRVAEVVARAMRVGKNRRRTKEGEGDEDEDEDEDRIGGDADDDEPAPAMALVADPERREARKIFADAAKALGLETVEAEFPGHANMRLLQCTRVELGVAE